MVIPIIGLSLTAIGDILIGFSILSVHSTVTKEGKIDKSVIRKMRFERILVISGIILIILGFIFNFIGK